MELLFDQEFTFRPEDSKTNCCVNFTVPRDFGQLVITCGYAPKFEEDKVRAKELIEATVGDYVPADLLPQYGNWERYMPLANLITLSLDFDGRYLGCAHRHAPHQEHTISKGFSSPGFFKTAAQAGEWRAVINVHAVVTEKALYHLRVVGMDEGEA